MLHIFACHINTNVLTDSWLGLRTVEKTEGLKVGRCHASMDKCDSKGFSLEPFGVLLLPDEPLELEPRIHRATGVLLPILNTCRSELVICNKRKIEPNVIVY